MAAGDAQEDNNSGEAAPGEDEGGGEVKKSKDSEEMADAGAAKGRKAAGAGGTVEGKSRRGRKPKGEAVGKKAGKKGKPSAEARPAVERPTRERKTVERFSVAAPQRAVAPKAVSIQEGSGTKLKDIPNVFFKLSKRRADENLQLLHTILFAKKAKALYLKRNIYQFSGFVWTENEEKQRAKVKEKLDKCVKDKLLDFCDILDIPVLKATTKKEEMSAKLLEFLESPHVTRDTVLAEKEQKGRKRKRTKETTEAASGDAGSDREKKKQKKSSASSATKKRRKTSGIGVASDVNQDGGAEESDDEENETEDGGDAQEPVVDKKVSPRKQKGKRPKSNDNIETAVKRGSPAKSAKSSSRSSSKKSPSEGKGRAPGNGSKGSSKRGSKASTKQEAEPAKRGSVKSNKGPLNSRTSDQVGKNDSGADDASKRKGEKGKGKQSETVTEDKGKKKSQPVLGVSAKKQGKEKASGKPEPTREEMHAVVRDILKEVDFNTATLADILRQLGSHFDTDLMHRKAEVKSIIEEVINDMTDDDEEGEDEDDADEATKDGDA